MGTPILHMQSPDTDWINVLLDPAIAVPFGTERNQVRMVGRVVELVLSVQLTSQWAAGVSIGALPSQIPNPRTQYRPNGAYGSIAIPVVIQRSIRLYSPAVATGIYRISDTWTV